MPLRGMDVRVESCGRGNRNGERRRSRIITRNPATVFMLGDLGRVPPVVVIHRELLKTELPEYRVTGWGSPDSFVSGTSSRFHANVRSAPPSRPLQT